MLVYEEASHKNFFLRCAETGEIPEDPFDAFTWFMPAFNEWLTEFFQTIINKINERGWQESDT